MTGLEALNSFNIESRTFQRNSNLKFESNEIEYLLNKAQITVFERYYDMFDKGENKNFALNELITVANLVWSTDASTNQTGAKTNGRIWKLPSNFYYSLEEQGVDSDGNFIRIKPIGRDYYNINILNPYKMPKNDLAWRLDHKPYPGENLKRRETITASDVTLVNYNITYIKKPSNIIVTNNTDAIELGDKAIIEVISEAINIGYAIDKDRLGYEISNVENAENIKN